MPNIKSTLQKLPKTFNILPKCRNFAKSGHTVVLWKAQTNEREVRLKWEREREQGSEKLRERERQR